MALLSRVLTIIACIFIGNKNLTKISKYSQKVDYLKVFLIIPGVHGKRVHKRNAEDVKCYENGKFYRCVHSPLIYYLVPRYLLK